MSFLTVEDVNSVNLNHINEYYELDTGKISQQEFRNVLYDFCIVSHTINGSEHTFTFEVHNSLWQGKCYFRKSDGSLINRTSTNNNYNNGVITLITEESSVKLYLYLCSFTTSFSYSMADLVTLDDYSTIIFTKADEGKNVTIYSRFLSNGNRQAAGTVTLNSGVNYISGTIKEYILCLLKKTDLIYNLDNDVTVGIVNNVPLNVDTDYLPGGNLVDEELLDIIVKYNDIEIPVYYDENIDDYCFDLDLTNKRDNKPVKLEIIVNEIDLINNSIDNVILNCNYSSASSYEELQSTIVSGAEIIELAGDITLNNNLIIPHNLLILANNHSIYLGSHNIQIPNNVSFEIDGGNFFNGINCFNQKINSKLVLKNCRFNNATISDNYKGSVISADYDGIDDSIITELIGCTFINCHHTIYHGGELTIKNCKALFNSFNDAVDTDYPAFLTAYDGTVEITNSTFDIDYDIDNLCDDGVDIKFAEALVGLGENTVFNGATTNQLKYNNSLPFFDASFNNKSHIFVKYYYPQINACVISSPVLGKEDSSVCHMILGTDWVYKNNVQVTRLSWQSENDVRKIEWRDI